MQEIRETWVRSLDQEDPLEEGMVHSPSVLVWKIAWSEEPGGLQSMELQRGGLNWVTEHLRWMCAKLLQSCLTLCDPMDCSPPGSSVHGILQGILEWIAMLSFRGSFCPRDWTWVSYISFIGRQVLRTTSKQKNKQTNKQNQFKWLFGWMRPQVSSQLA